MENNEQQVKYDLAVKFAHLVKIRIAALMNFIKETSEILGRKDPETLPLAAKRVIEERDKYKHACLELLARIHRDGGHHVERYGFEKSLADADQIVANLNQLADNAAVDNLLKEFK